MLRKDIQCILLQDGTLSPAPAGHQGNNVVSVVPPAGGPGAPGGYVTLGNNVIAYLSYDFTGNRIVGYTPTTDSPNILQSLERLFPLF